MELTQKETMLLQDLKGQEQLCVEKYSKYAATACDPALKTLFAQIGSEEQEHLNTVTQMMGGTVPSTSGGQKPQAAGQSSYGTLCDNAAKQTDTYLCSDVLGTEKHVSSVYDTCIFEFKDMAARDALNHIQKEEQLHGKLIYDYMAANSMYC